MEEITELSNRWMSLPISLIGRINIIKMNLFHKILYLIQNIPLPPPEDFFQKLNKLFLRFIWNSNRARIRMSLLHLSYSNGRPKCPNVLWYYWAVQLRSMKFYFTTRDIPQWEEMESEGLSLPLPLYLYSDTLRNLIKQSSNPVVKNMIQVWFKVRQCIEEPG